MRALRLIAGRTFGECLARFSSWAGAAMFLGVAGGVFAGGLFLGEGGTLGVPALWARAADVAMPVLAAALAMGLWGDVRGRRALALATPVPEREVAGGKVVGAWLFSLVVLLLFLCVPVFLLGRFAPAISGETSFSAFVPAFLLLAARSALWCSIGALAGALTSSAAAAFATTIVFSVAPYVAYRTAVVLVPAVRMRFAEYPMSAHMADFAGGAVSPAQLAFCALFAMAAVFAAGKVFAASRWVGRHALLHRLPFWVAAALAFVLAALSSIAVARLDFVLDWPTAHAHGFVSPRTRQILEEVHGELRVTCLVPRNSSQFRSLGRLLRGFESAARAAGGVRFSCSFVDPSWDLGEAASLVRAGLPVNSMLVERGRRRLTLAIGEVDESSLAAAIQRLSLPARRETVRFTSGHGESSPLSYDVTSGLSDFARVLRRAGYEVEMTDLASETAVPSDCAVLVVAGATSPFSRIERDKVDAYLKHGGRMLVLASDSVNNGVSPLLSTWGVQVSPLVAASARTRTGSDFVTGDFGVHRITRPLAGSEVVFAGNAASLALDVGTNLVTAIDRATAHELVRVSTSVGPCCVAAALEKGGTAAEGLAQRPTRIVVVADPVFATNGALADRGHANADFLLNSVAYLAGLDAAAAVDRPADVLSTGMSRADHVKFAAASALAFPMLVILIGLVVRTRRRM